MIQCTGYLKSWAPAKARPEEQEGETENDACNLSCLVAVGRVQPPLPIPLASRGIRLQATMFVSRHAVDGEFLYVDQKYVVDSRRKIFLMPIPMTNEQKCFP